MHKEQDKKRHTYDWNDYEEVGTQKAFLESRTSNVGIQTVVIVRWHVLMGHSKWNGMIGSSYLLKITCRYYPIRDETV